jgi:peptidoglycan-associated lipoprotein
MTLSGDYSMFKRVLAAFAVAVVLVGCSSVPLTDVPVEDKSASSVNGPPGPNQGAQSSVAPVVTDTANGAVAGPANVARIIYFDYDSYEIKSEFQPLIEAHARFLKANSARRVSIEGHTDERGGREYNLALGQRRAEAVRRALVLLGVADNRLEAVSFGKEKPAVPGSDEAAWAQNRRAELVYHR